MLGELVLNSKFVLYLGLACVFHVGYNIISLTVILAAFNPVQHALLNVAKRITVVIALFIFSNKFISSSNVISAIVCLAVTIVGTSNLNTEEKHKNEEEPKKRTSHNDWNKKSKMTHSEGTCLPGEVRTGPNWDNF